MNKKEKISILGCGWYGLPLAKKLIENGYQVKGSTTTEAKIEELTKANIAAYLVKLEAEETVYDPDFFDCDILFISIPPRSKSPELKNFQLKIGKLISLVNQYHVKQVIFISSTGIYQDGNFVVNENDRPVPDTEVGRTLLEAENSFLVQQFTATILRFGGLIGPNRNLAKHFAGKKDIPNGLAPINLIHLNDCVGISLSIVEQKAFGYIYHGVAPSHPTRADFYTKACENNGLEPPTFVKELNNWKQVESEKVFEILNYQFSVKQLLTEN